MRILIVDDEALGLSRLKRMLGTLGFDDITEAADADEARDAVIHSHIDLALLDINMPGLTGLEVLPKIIEVDPDAVVIMLTGHATVESAIEGMKLGAFDYLLKPCDMDHLISKVNEAASKKRQHEEKIINARIKEITARRA